MEMMKYWVRTHQLTAFFLVTFGITFGLWFCFDPVMNQGIAFLVFLMSVAICGPGLAGIIISRISSEEPAVGSIKTTWMVFLVAFGLILVDQMWQKLDSHHPAVIRTSKTQKQEERYGLSLLPR